MTELNNGPALMIEELDAVAGGSAISNAVETVLDGIDNLLGGSKTVETLQNKIDPYWRRT